jgi:hypothetical protein
VHYCGATTLHASAPLLPLMDEKLSPRGRHAFPRTPQDMHLAARRQPQRAAAGFGAGAGAQDRLRNGTAAAAEVVWSEGGAGVPAVMIDSGAATFKTVAPSCRLLRCSGVAFRSPGLRQQQLWVTAAASAPHRRRYPRLAAHATLPALGAVTLRFSLLLTYVVLCCLFPLQP